MMALRPLQAQRANQPHHAQPSHEPLRYARTERAHSFADSFWRHSYLCDTLRYDALTAKAGLIEQRRQRTEEEAAAAVEKAIARRLHAVEAADTVRVFRVARAEVAALEADALATRAAEWARQRSVVDEERRRGKAAMVQRIRERRDEARTSRLCFDAGTREVELCLSKDEEESARERREALARAAVVSCAAATACRRRPAAPGESAVRVGHQVALFRTPEMLHGTVRFVGKTALARGELVGVELEKRRGRHDGQPPGQPRYFECQAGHGVFVRPEDVVVVGATPQALLQLSPVRASA